tara:strand:- start:4057 stop:4869 length:813 start_codon:yes stop_codon:yes gene_type:complete
MTELEQFIASVEGKSANTVKTYKSQYNKLFKLIGKDISETSEAKLLSTIDTIDNINGKQALINIAIQIRRLYKLSVLKLEAEREKNKQKLIESVKDTNLKLQNSLPSYEELIDFMQALYESKSWTDYIINYLLINYQVRNQDLLFEIVKLKRDTTDTTKNYIWLAPSKIVYIRNVYKTAGKYGQKVVTITDPKFITAIKKVLEKSEVFIPNENQLGYYIQKATYKQIGEGNVMKIVINHFRRDLNKIKEISESRGTSIDTILSNYDIDNV